MDTKETTIYRAALIAAAVIGTIILYFIIFIFRQQRKHRLLYKAKIEAEITTLEKERERIAADLHDDLGPILSAAKFKIAGISTPTGEDVKLAAESLGFIDTILGRIRFIANDLMPNTLLRDGPVSAIEEFIYQMSLNSTLKISFQQRNVPPIPQSQAIHIYRILQEIIHNTVKHANAKRLTIKLFRSGNNLVIATADDGRGFKYDTAGKEQYGRGLSNLQSRTEILSGEMHLRSRPRKGTSYTIEIPIIHITSPASP